MRSATLCKALFSAAALAPQLQRTPPVHLCAADDDSFEGIDGFFRRQLLALPNEPDTCLLQVRKAIQEALDAGSQRLWIDINVPELDYSSRGFDPDIMGKFAAGVAQELDADDGAPVIFAHGLTSALAATKAVRNANFADGFGSVCVVPLGSGGGEDDDDNEGIALLANSPARPLVILGPATGQPEHPLSRKWRSDMESQGRVLLLFNHRPAQDERGRANPSEPNRLTSFARGLIGRPPPPPPILLDPPASFDVVFELAPVVLQDSRLNRPSTATAATDAPPPPPPPGESFLSVRGRPFVPKAVLVRRFPSSWALLVNADDSGYEEVKAFERRPRGASMVDLTGRHVRKRQQALRQQPDDADEVSGSGELGGAGGEATERGVGGAGVAPSGRSSGVLPGGLPEGVEARTWAELDAGSDGSFKWYQSACLLRLRAASARKAAADAASTATETSVDGDAMWTDDRNENAIHLYAAEASGWRAHPVRLAACALLLLDASGPGVATMPVIEVSEAGQRVWVAQLLEAAEGLARARAQTTLRVWGVADGLSDLCLERGYQQEQQGDSALGLEAGMNEAGMSMGMGDAGGSQWHIRRLT